jgi:hypothetical protein
LIISLTRVDAGDQFGDRVLDLDAGVHLDEEEFSGVFVVEKFEGAGAAVADRTGKLDRRSAELVAHLGGETGGRRLLPHLLAAALD